MSVLILMLRGVNLGGRRMKMDALRALCESLKLKDVCTYIQAGNVVFRTNEKKPDLLARRIEQGIEREFGFRSDVILRTAPEMRDVIARNPFAGRRDVLPNRLLVWFLADAPSAEAREKVLAMQADPEELRLDGREVYVHFPNGMARPKLSMPAVERALKVSGTGRNWNSVVKLLEIAERLEALE